MNPNKWINTILSFQIYIQNNDDDDVVSEKKIITVKSIKTSEHYTKVWGYSHGEDSDDGGENKA